MNARITKWLCLWAVGCCLVGMAPAYAAIDGVTPAEGTVGSEFTIYGSNFGDKRGKVDLGEESCKVLFWSNTEITCEVKKAQPAGEYTITVAPQGSKKKSVPMVSADPYVIRTPHIDAGKPLRLVEPLEVVTITGDYFGKKKGLVGLRDTSGLTLEAKVLDWIPNAITFRIPEGLTGTCILGVLNDVGVGIQRYWCTFTPLPPNPLRTTETYFIKETHENATGVFFNNEFWIFSPEKDLLGDTSNEILVWTYNFKDGTFTSEIGPRGSTDAQLAPIVINHELWLFATGEKGHLYWKKLTVVGSDSDTGEPTYEWEDDWHWILEGETTEPDKELAPIWNPIKNRLELFYYNSQSIYWVYTVDKGQTWSAPKQVTGLGTVSSAPSATFFQKSEDTGVVLLAFSGPLSINDPDHDYAKVYAVQDGVTVSTQPLWWSAYASSQPFIGHLGEDYIGVVYENGPLDQIDVAKMNKKTEAWNYDPLVPYIDQDVVRSPSFALNMEEHEDASAPLGVRYDVEAYLFWGHYRGAIGTGAYMTPVEHLGYWLEEDQVDVLNATEANAEKTELFDLWTVIGIVDAPPYVLNGDTYNESCDELSCTNSVFVSTEEKKTTFGYDMSVGAFMETGEKSIMKMELTETMAAKYESSSTKTYEIKDMLYRSYDGTVLVYYLVPTFEIHHMHWFDLTGVETDNYFHMVIILDAQMQSHKFDPREFPYTYLNGIPGMPDTYFGPEFPIHASADETCVGDWARLLTYDKAPDPDDEIWFEGTAEWNRSGDGSVKWTDKEEETQTTSFEVTYKFGVNLKDYLSFGTQGSFGVNVGSTVTTILSNELTLVAGLEHGEPFKSFQVDGYWLAPKANAYWVPQNRLDDGDSPWFITYRVYRIDSDPLFICQ